MRITMRDGKQLTTYI
uniref:Uncharacterized protein n=1 Tax=Anguilla anguilla TaxID=7936 RepID=A0A0E9VKB2_ANGAN